MNGNASSTVVATNNSSVGVVSANKRKISGGGRPNSTRGLRPKGTMDRSISAEGIYSNIRFMNAATAIVGCVARVFTVEGAVYEGIFRTFSPGFEFVMEMAHKIDEKAQHKPGQLSICGIEEIAQTLIFKPSDVEFLTSSNADLEYAAKDMFATDSSISKFNGQPVAAEKELEPWDGTGTDPDAISQNLEMDSSTNGWDVNDMFRTNEQQYGVQSSYDNSLTGYTIALEKKNTDEYKKQEMKAIKLASEIENSSMHRVRSALENVDEDEKISAVVRPGDNNFIPKYVTPQKRKNQPNAGKLGSRGGSNASSQGSYGMSSGGRMGPSGMPHMNHSQLHGSGTGVPGSGYNRLPHTSNNNSGLSQHQHHSVGSQSSVSHYQHIHRQQTSPPGLSNNLNASTTVASASANATMSGDLRKTSPLHHQISQQVLTENEARLNCESRVDKLEVESNKSKQLQQQHSSATENVRREAIAASETRSDSNSEINSNNSVATQHQQPPNSLPIQITSNHIQSKLPRKEMISKVNRDKETADLKKFQTNFKLPTNEEKEDSNIVSPSTVDENESKEKVDSDLEKSANGLKKFTLNPNAKEFVLNPNAKAFTPRTPSAQTPTPPRAHTPGAMMTQPATISIAPGHIITAAMPSYMSPLAAVSLASPIGQATMAMHQGGGPRFRKNDSEHYQPMTTADGRRVFLEASMPYPFTHAAPPSVPRPDFSHVAAATGQPILAPNSSISQASFVQYQPQGMVAHGVPQNMPYTTQMCMITPRLMTAQGLSMVPTSHLVQHTDPQHVPSQMFLSAHPGVPPQLTPGPTPSHANHTPIPNLNQSGPHNASSQGQQQQQNQVSSMHPNPSPVHGGNTPTQQNPSNQPQGGPNAQQLNAFSNQHQQTMGSAQLQGGSHTPNSPQSMHPGQVNNSNPTHYLQASLVAHAAATNAAPHGNQAHPHPSQGGYPGTQMVLLPPPGPGTPNSMTGHPTMNTHTLQGHAIGHGGVAQLVPHTPMVIPATSTGQQLGSHPIFMPHHGGRPNALQGRVVCAVPTQSYQL